MWIPSFVLIGYCVNELHSHICPYRNVWPEAVYCCFARTTLFTKLFTCLYDRICGEMSPPFLKFEELLCISFLKQNRIFGTE